ncbi:hypothetical protein ACGFIK_17650 [Micromonospora sp. NPDC048871]|uniref:hypothetical protein n=1 Tax=unclassified Micromonospora TaxID=2617518 RepID=UPI002E1117F3|nr:hypothetical protein OIE53_24915 [Micromonospora sp. NBC_01739]
MPSDDGDAVQWLLFEQSGMLSWAQATAELTPAKVRHLLATGRWGRVCRGILRAAPPSEPYRQEQQWWAAVLAAGPGAVLAGLAAATAGGLRGRWRYQTVDVLVPHHRRQADLLRRLPLGLPAVRVRRVRHLPDEDAPSRAVQACERAGTVRPGRRGPRRSEPRRLRGWPGPARR